MIRKKQALSVDFEGLMGAGKTTVILRLAAQISPQTHTLWRGTGFPYSLKRAIRDNTGIAEWMKYRQNVLKNLAASTDYMLLERSSLHDFSNLCFRKKLISEIDLTELVADWWPSYVVLIDTPFEQCIKNMAKRGDPDPDRDDLEAFYRSTDQARDFLGGLIGDKLVVVENGQAAFDFALAKIKEATINHV